MKKTAFLSIAAIGILGMTSCSNEEMPALVENDNSVTFSISVPSDLQSRTFGDGVYKDGETTLHYGVFEQKNGEDVLMLSSKMDVAPKVTKVDNFNFTLTVNLVKGKTYDFVFWADNGNSIYSISDDFKTMTCNYSENTYLSDENTDAFYFSYKGVTINGPKSLSAIMRRPFAQVNLGTFDSDIKNAALMNLNINDVDLEVVGAYTQLDLLSGVASNPVTEPLKFKAAGLPNLDNDGDFPYQIDAVNNHISYLAMAYILTGTEILNNDVRQAQQELMNLTYHLNMNDGSAVEVAVPSAPVQRNYRTNIYGSLITSPMDWTLTINPDTYDDVNIEAPVAVNSEEQLKEALRKGGKIALTNDINITKAIQVTKNAEIDLGNHTISNTSTSNNNDALLVSDATVIIKNGKLVSTPNGQNNNYGASIFVQRTANVTLENVEAEGLCNVWVNSAASTVTINSGTFKSSGTQSVYANAGKVTINGGTFSNSGLLDGRNYLLNVKDGSTASISVTGGKYIGYDPANSTSENPVASFVAAGYKSVVDADGNFTVVAE